MYFNPKSNMKSSLLYLFLLISFSSSAQSAREYLQTAVHAYGPWQSVQTFSYGLEGYRIAVAQGKTYKSGEKQHYFNTKTFDYSSNKAFEQNTNIFPGGWVFKFANMAIDTTFYSWDIDQNRGGKILNKGGAAQAKQIYNFRNNQIPYYRVQEINETTDSLVLLPKEGALTRIQRFPATGNPIVYTFDTTNKLISVDAPASKQRLVFSDYVSVNGFTNSATVTLFIDDALATEEKIKNWNYNFTPAQNQFNIPEGYTQTVRGAISVSEIAKDVFLIDNIGGDRNVLFVNMDEYIVVIEAPLSSETSKDILKRIKETIPGKPVKYVFATHFHSDHTGGLRQYAFEDAILLMAENTTAYVNDLLGGQQKDDFGKSGKKADIQTFRNMLELKDKNHHIIFYEVPNTHADGMALAYFPKEKIIYQGDLLSVPLDGSLPYSVNVIQEMQDFIQKNKITYNRMVGHHGLNNITPEMVKQILNNKKEVKY